MNVVENTIRVHEVYLEEFHAKIAKANRRLVRNGIEGQFVVHEVGCKEITDEDGSVEYVYEFAMNSPSFEYAGWEFLAAVEILDGGTLLRIAPGKEMPEGYVRPEAHVCEHCNVSRSRAKSYIVREVATGVVKQIGSSCLAVFLGVEPKGLWGLGFIEELDEYREPREGGPSAPLRWTIERVIRMAYAVTDGGKSFVSKGQARDWEDKVSSSHLAAEVLTYRPRPRESAELKAWVAQMEADAAAVEDATVAEILAYADELGGDYGENMRVLVASSAVEYGHLGLLVSLVGVWYRAKVRKAEDEADRKASLNEWIGTEKERLRNLELAVTNVREYEGDYGTTTYITFRDAEGRTLQWKASGTRDLEVGHNVKLTGTVKKHEVYRERNITQLARCVYEIV